MPEAAILLWVVLGAALLVILMIGAFWWGTRPSLWENTPTWQTDPSPEGQTPVSAPPTSPLYDRLVRFARTDGVLGVVTEKLYLRILGPRPGPSLGPEDRVAYAMRYGDRELVPVFTDVLTAVRSPGVDAVIITTPSGAHLEPALQAAAAGKHVVVEKPLEVTGPRCQQVIDACARARVQLCTIFPSRFADSSAALKAAVDAGKFGRLTLGEAANKWWRSQAYYDDGGWKGTQALDGGGALMNQAIHNVDLLLWMMGPADTVCGLTATLAHERIEVEDTAVAAIRFKSGALGVLQATTSVHPGYPKQIAVHGDTLVWELNDGEISHYTVAPAELGVDKHTLEDLRGGDGEENAAAMRATFAGEGPAAHRDAVAVNAGAMFYLYGMADSLAEGTAQAKQ